ncbi:hypothetical protein D3C75_679240 [compost metagenome]
MVDSFRMISGKDVAKRILRNIDQNGPYRFINAIYDPLGKFIPRKSLEQFHAALLIKDRCSIRIRGNGCKNKLLVAVAGAKRRYCARDDIGYGILCTVKKCDMPFVKFRQTG